MLTSPLTRPSMPSMPICHLTVACLPLLQVVQANRNLMRTPIRLMPRTGGCLCILELLGNPSHLPHACLPTPLLPRMNSLHGIGTNVAVLTLTDVCQASPPDAHRLRGLHDWGRPCQPRALLCAYLPPPIYLHTASRQRPLSHAVQHASVIGPALHCSLEARCQPALHAEHSILVVAS